MRDNRDYLVAEVGGKSMDWIGCRGQENIKANQEQQFNLRSKLCKPEHLRNWHYIIISSGIHVFISFLKT